MKRCQSCNGTGELRTSDDGVDTICVPCLRFIARSVDHDPTLAETWWKWVQDVSGHRGRTSAS